MSENGKELTVIDVNTMMKLVGGCDTSALSPEQKLTYYKSRCEAAGVDPRTAPFQFIRLQGREVLYATKGLTDQLASNHKIKVEVLSQETSSDVRIVMVRASAGDGRSTDEMGAVPVVGLKGNDLANAYMKAITKAKRRAILSLCGLGVLDETEIETIPEAVRSDQAPVQQPERKRVETSEVSASVTGHKVISLPQAKRFFAISKEAGKTDDEIKTYFASIGISRSSEIPIKIYDEACKWAETRTSTVATTGELIGDAPEQEDGAW